MSEASWQIERVILEDDGPALRLRLDMPGRALFVLMDPGEAADLADALATHARSLRIESVRQPGARDNVVLVDRDFRNATLIRRTDGNDEVKLQPRQRRR
ncbi:MAG: hypothetical protein U1E62_07780 [Alsobacter sp.]